MKEGRGERDRLGKEEKRGGRELHIRQEKYIVLLFILCREEKRYDVA